MTTPLPDPARKAILAAIAAVVLALAAIASWLAVDSQPSGPSSQPPASASVSVSRSPSPSPSATVLGCVSNPGACGYPDATSAGARGALAKHAGSLTTDHDGQVVQGLDVEGCLKVVNADVVIKNVLVEGGCARSLDLSNATGHTTVTDVTVRATASQASAVVLRNATLTRVDVSGGNDGIDVWGGDVSIADSFVHDLSRADGSHDDAVQVTGGGDVLVKHSTLLARVGSDPMNACVQLGTLTGKLGSFAMSDSLCDGGNYSVNANTSAGSFGPVSFVGNRFGAGYRYGVKANLGPLDLTWSGNLDDATGKPVG